MMLSPRRQIAGTTPPSAQICPMMHASLVRANSMRCLPGWSQGLLLVALSACAAPRPPTVTPHAATITTVSLRGLDLDVQVRVDNPNSFPLSAQAVTGTLFLAQGGKLGHGSSRPGHSIPARGSSLVHSWVHVEWDDLSALKPFLTAESVPYSFRGDVTLGGENFNVTVPFSLSGELTRTQLLKAGVRGL